MANPTLHHTVNAVVATAPVVSEILNFPAAVTVVLGCLGIVYYAIVIGEKIVGWRAQWLQIHQSSKAVAAKIIEDKKE